MRSGRQYREKLPQPSVESLLYPALETIPDLADALVDIGAIDRVHEKRLAVVGNLDRQRAWRQRDQIGEYRDLEVAFQVQRIGEDAWPQVHPWRGDQPRHAPAGQDQLLDEERGERQYPARTMATAPRLQLLSHKVERQPAEQQAEGEVRQGEGASERGPYQRQQDVV